MPEDRPSWRQEQTIALKRAIQSAALRLFTEQGYAATTVGMIAKEVGVAERTCFRHFATKPDLVLWDGADYDLLARFRNWPADGGVVTAFREALSAGYATLDADQRALETHRNALIATVPEVRAAHLDHFASAAREFTQAVAERAGRPADDPDIIAVSGAIIGIMMIHQLDESVPDAADADQAARVDAALARLQAGFGTL